MAKRSIYFVIVLLTFTSCQDEADCISVTTDFANLQFYKIQDNELDTVDFISLKPLLSDSILLADTTINGTIQLPINPNTESTAYAFETEFGLDTLILGYNTSTRLIAEDCGIEVIIFELKELRNDFDSIRIVNDVLIEDINEDIRIYN
ncbi:MAG: DUF6452 family protein [Bacteroidota bacterium]